MKALLATDGLPASDEALHLLVNLIDRSVDVSVVSVTHSGSLIPAHLPLQLDPIEARREDSLAIAQGAAAQLAENGFHANARVAEGSPGPEIARLAEEGDYDVVFVGAGSHSWLGNKLLGSVSTYLLHNSTRSLVIAHDATAGSEGRRVLAGVDGSHEARRAARLLVGLLDSQRCEVEVLGVVPVDVPVHAPIPAGSWAEDEATYRKNQDLLHEVATTNVRETADMLRSGGLRTTYRVADGGATEVLLQASADGNFDLVVVGSRGLGPARRVLLGSVSDHVARLAPAALVGRFGEGADPV